MNVVFLLTNVVLNVILILWIGWVGAAIATATSAVIGLALAFRELRKLVDFTLPLGELGRQLAAATVMGVIILSLRKGIEEAELLRHNVVLVFLLVTLGAGVYFLVLLGISSRFRQTVAANSPIPIPFLTS